ncbi:hypothetical protein [Bacillus sp. BP-3]|uniref:hypothetical protein n=1 Tax=Bacillus sp. BP-3 TaxID=3022773 RepID=UPI00232B87BE|nr:hypothetical protein [Bacillus sp. BP-3]MDC2864367.1 hypothetical protein [Bacillus sp. BP-3]
MTKERDGWYETIIFIIANLIRPPNQQKEKSKNYRGAAKACKRIISGFKEGRRECSTI